ncbi:MAG: phosphate ABC transporter ATP-binding protein [Candidatus Bathyarchaeota archaeon B24]|nr:MAG: phosphate ABC transporter ATP-binding protein [Candidatus Bathyarchaeota archaeon B24]
MDPKIEVRELNVWYGNHHVLKDLSIKIPERRVLAIIGPSGCGKSTLLMTLNRMIELVEGARVEGRCLLDGVDIYNPGIPLTELRRRVGMVFQKPNPLPKSIYENVAYGPKVHGVKDRRKLDEIVENCLKVVGLWDEVKDRLNKSAFELSVGQQQRLCIARALAVKPEVLLMDEPCSALDPMNTRIIEKLICSLGRELTVVVVTHNIQQAARVSDFTAFIYLGRLVEYGPTDRLFESPVNRLTRDYISGEFG